MIPNWEVLMESKCAYYTTLRYNSKIV